MTTTPTSPTDLYGSESDLAVFDSIKLTAREARKMQGSASADYEVARLRQRREWREADPWEFADFKDE